MGMGHSLATEPGGRPSPALGHMRIEAAFERAKEGTILQGALTPENLLSTLTGAVLVVGMLVLILTIFIK
jgi:hypothetical protein